MADLPARIAFADGTILHGRSVGARGTAGGEAVFNTGMTGYQEILSDPSYRGQLVTMTYPEIGNYGANPDDMESDRAQVAGFIMRSCCEVPSNFRARESLGAFLKRSGIVGIDQVDTRAITRKLRVLGAMNAVITSEAMPDAELLARARALPSMEGLDLATAVGTAKPYQWSEAASAGSFLPQLSPQALPRPAHVVAIDFGIKRNILRLLASLGLRITVVPASATPAEVLGLAPDGIFLSNGPGDPAAVTQGIATVRALAATELPIFGICLGHQILALAYRARTYKLKFGHRGANHPIRRMSDGQVEIASHNHGFAVDPASLPAELRVSHVNLNDQTCAGIEHVAKPQFSVQYHPEAGPGPADPLYLFRQFAERIAAHLGAAAGRR